MAGSESWLVDAPPAARGFLWFLVPVLLGGPGVAYTFHVSGERGRHDFGDAAIGRPWEAVLGGRRESRRGFVLPKRVWTVSTLTSALLDGA